MAVVVSGGRARQVNASWPFRSVEMTSSFTGARTIDLLRDSLTATYEGIYRSQPWVFAAVSRLSFWTARIPLKLYTGDLSDERERIRDGDLAALLKRPNPRTRMPRLILDESWDYYLYGNSLLVKYRPSAGAPPAELWHVPWRYVQPRTDESGRIVAYTVAIGGQSYTLTPNDVIHNQYPRGIAPLEALARTVQSEDAAMSYQTESLRSGVLPRAAFTTPEKLKEADVARLRTELDKLYAGPGEGSGRFALLHSDLKYERAIGMAPSDLGLVESRKISREEVAAAFDISPPFLGILDRATFNNIAELRESSTQDSLGPKLEVRQADVQAQLIDCEPVWDALGYSIEYDMGAILKPNPEAAARQALMEQQSSTTTIDERRRMRNLKPLGIAGVTDVVLIPANMTPAGAPPAAEPPSNRTLTDDVTAEAFRAGQPPRTGDNPARMQDDPAQEANGET